ncbi:MAG: hypothetical protein LUG93_08255 [Lachnospiraceae bacterium]|nr:hypothetical protein [Lachnospiraceae bacterium]
MCDILFDLQDMRWLDWAVRKISPGTPGCFLKAYEENDGKRVYYKLSNYDSYRGVFGHECVNELIVSRTMDILGIPHVPYRLIHARITVDGKEIETWISASDNFRRENEEKLAYDLFYDLQKKETESPLDFAIRNGWELSIYQMFVIDYLVANRDRHGSNLEILRNQEDGTIRLAPLFDQGVSLLFSTYGDEKLIENTDVMREFAVNNYIGSRSLEYNLSLIPEQFDLKLNSLRKANREFILGGTEEILSENHRNKVWEMIWKRWCYFESIRNKKESL